ncbi:threonine ammonia-lyase [Merdibacter massiliensis]|uniref:threonine ammonia-lyase n=1 Tax=Merdibacter massiliensis TaxID=1871030 RepID=UPI00117A5CD1|nr:threonine ammonia-lyase [Merdibacter massiliensis]
MESKDVEAAAKRLQGKIHNIHVSSSNTFSQMSGCELYLKCENRQKTGSFKVRGAYNKLAKLKETGSCMNVIASSAGNHAQGVSYASAQLGMHATIVMPKSTPIAKVSATQGYGAEVILAGDNYDACYEEAKRIQKERGATFIHPFDDEDVIAGQGTIAYEILQDLPDADIIVVPAGGGGLLSGISLYAKQINPHIKIVGVQAEGADAIVRSFKAGKHCSTPSVNTIADGIAVMNPGELTVKIIQENVDEMVRVSDDEIASTILLLLEREKQVVEPSGASSLAAVLNHKIDVAGKKVVCVLSGGNIDVSFIHKVVEKGLVTRGRNMKFKTPMLDVPGSLEKMARILHEVNANIIEVRYDRIQADLGLNETIIHIGVEVSSKEHGAKMLEKLKENGYDITVE